MDKTILVPDKTNGVSEANMDMRELRYMFDRINNISKEMQTFITELTDGYPIPAETIKDGGPTNQLRNAVKAAIVNKISHYDVPNLYNDAELGFNTYTVRSGMGGNVSNLNIVKSIYDSTSPSAYSIANGTTSYARNQEALVWQSYSKESGGMTASLIFAGRDIYWMRNNKSSVKGRGRILTDYDIRGFGKVISNCKESWPIGLGWYLANGASNRPSGTSSHGILMTLRSSSEYMMQYTDTESGKQWVCVSKGSGWGDWKKAGGGGAGALEPGDDKEVSLDVGMVGVPVPYPTWSLPRGYLAMHGQTFSKSRYPFLARVYPSGRLPDMRRRFIGGANSSSECQRYSAGHLPPHVHGITEYGNNAGNFPSGPNLTCRLMAGASALTWWNGNNGGWCNHANGGERNFSMDCFTSLPVVTEKHKSIYGSASGSPEPSHTKFHWICFAGN